MQNNVIPFCTTRRAIRAGHTTTSATGRAPHRQPPAIIRQALSRPRPHHTVGDYVMHNGTRFAGQVGHILDADISHATRSITRYLVSFSGIHTWLRPDEIKPATRAHHIVATAKAGA